MAVAVFNERGYDGTGMEEPAGRLGLSKSSVHHHVSGKGERLELAVGRALDALFSVLDGVDGAGAPGTTATVRLEHVVHRGIEVLVAEPPYVTLLLRVRGDNAVERRALERRREFDHRVGPSRSPVRPSRAVSAPASIRISRPGCCSAPSTRSSSGTGRRVDSRSQLWWTL